MYSEFYKLRVNPFGETPDTRFFFRAESSVQSLDLALGAIRSGKGFTLLTGEVGVGKTILSRLLLNYLQKRTPTALILNPVLSQLELLTSIREEFKIPAPSVVSIKSEYDQLSKFQIETAQAQKRSILIIDEAQRLTFEGLEAVRLLSNLETEERKLLQIVLIGQPELKARLEEFDLRQLNQRISVRSELGPLKAHEVESYIKHRIEFAGGANFVRFESDAVAWIARASGGVPRVVNALCEQAIVHAERDKARLIDAAMLRRILPGFVEPRWRSLLSFGRSLQP